MVKRCSWGTCNADARYPEKLDGAWLIPFPKPKRNLKKCLRWITACGRLEDKLNVDNIDKNKSVCSRHFVGGMGPTADNPDPIQVGFIVRREKEILKRKSCPMSALENVPVNECLGENAPESIRLKKRTENSSQTEESCTAEIEMLKLEVEQIKGQLLEKEGYIKKLEQGNKLKALSVNHVLKLECKIPDLFRYYTGITHNSFMRLSSFLLDSDCNVTYEKGRKDIQTLSNEDALLLTLCRLRHDFGLKDLAVRFNLSVQSCSCVFNFWISKMYNKFGQMNIWPHRDVIIDNMPSQFKKDFPTTLIIIDGTELKTEVPNSLSLKSQMYSDYKSSSTFKGLIGCNPNGSLMYCSELYTGSISDKAITEQSGFYKLIELFKQKGHILEGDAVMADKGFTISEELRKQGIFLNIPPFTSTGVQMSISDTNVTKKIAKHRIHIERLIARVKSFKIVSYKVPATLFQSINQILTVCCFLTLFQEGYLPSS